MEDGIGSFAAQNSAEPSPLPAADLAADELRAAGAGLEPLPTGLETTGAFSGSPKAVLFDVYGTLLISGSGDIGSAERNAELAEAVDAAFSAALAELPELSSPAGASLRRRLAPEARRLYFSAIRETHHALKQRGVDHPEVEIRTVWRTVLHRLAAAAEVHNAARGTERAAAGGRAPGAASDARSGAAWSGLSNELVARVALRYELKANPVALMPGAAELLALLRERGVPLGIVSNAQFFTPLVVETLFERSLEALGFEAELCAWSYQAGVAKPSPALFAPVLEELRRRYALQPHQVLYIGNDMGNDIAPAAELGMQTALFAGDRRSLRLRAERLEDLAVKPDLVIAHWNDLRSILRREKDLA